MLASGLKPLVSPPLETTDAIQTWLEELFKTGNRPTAIFSLNHRTSTCLLNVLPAMHLRIPEDVALIGFDDFELAGMVTPSLTTVAQSPVEMAQRASVLLFERIANNGKDGYTAAKMVLPVRLIIRNSCGCIS